MSHKCDRQKPLMIGNPYEVPVRDDQWDLHDNEGTVYIYSGCALIGTGYEHELASVENGLVYGPDGLEGIVEE